MRKATLLAIVASIASTVYADIYNVTITRKSDNLYKIERVYPTIYIITRYCYEYVYNEDAVLSYDRYSYNNKLIFESGDVCEVESVVSE